MLIKLIDEVPNDFVVFCLFMPVSYRIFSFLNYTSIFPFRKALKVIR